MDSFHITIAFYSIMALDFDRDSSVGVYLRFSKAVYAATGTCVHIKRLTTHP